tara:strand:+ start:648 stop:893 length:246 start_codon:yes stop_codon:yes gene_type:complete
MSEQDQPQMISIDNLNYNLADISDTCKELLGDTQNANQAIQLLASLLNNAKAGSDAKFKEACKLLPEPAEELTGELADKAH